MQRFHEMARSDQFDRTMDGIDAAREAGLWPIVEDVERFPYRVRFEQVVRAKPAQDILARGRESLDQGVCLAAIGLAHPVGDPLRIAPNDVHASIRRSTVDHEDLQFLRCHRPLIHETLQRLSDEPPLVERRHHDRESGPSHFRIGSW